MGHFLRILPHVFCLSVLCRGPVHSADCDCINGSMVAYAKVKHEPIPCSCSCCILIDTRMAVVFLSTGKVATRLAHARWAVLFCFLSIVRLAKSSAYSSTSKQ